jgi:hypothetical protein
MAKMKQLDYSYLRKLTFKQVTKFLILTSVFMLAIGFLLGDGGLLSSGVVLLFTLVIVSKYYDKHKLNNTGSV